MVELVAGALILLFGILMGVGLTLFFAFLGRGGGE